MSREVRWKEMPNAISDEMLEEWAIVGTRDEFSSRMIDRCSEVFTTVLLDLDRELRSDEDWVAKTVSTLQSA